MSPPEPVYDGAAPAAETHAMGPGNVHEGWLRKERGHTFGTSRAPNGWRAVCSCGWEAERKRQKKPRAQEDLERHEEGLPARD